MVAQVVNVGSGFWEICIQCDLQLGHSRVFFPPKISIFLSFFVPNIHMKGSFCGVGPMMTVHNILEIVIAVAR